jgi:nucleotide-binding universal stress UspA family protein
MLKRILIPLEEYDYSKAAINYGIHLASCNECELVGISIIDIPSIEKSIGPVPVGGTFYAQKEEDLRKAEEKKLAEKLIAEFKAMCQAEKVPYHVKELQGNPEEIIIDESKYYDLVIMGWKTSFRYGEGEDKHLQHKLISQGISPVMLIPKTYQEIKKILLCYDGKNQSSKAIRQFIRFYICKDKQFILLNINDDPEEGDKLLTKMGEYLALWEVPYEKVILEGHPREAIEAFVKEKDIDLLVLGAHGHQGIASFLFGSTTQKLIKDADRPLFIYH